MPDKIHILRIGNEQSPRYGGYPVSKSGKLRSMIVDAEKGGARLAGEHDGPKEAVLLYHNGNPVNSPQPRLITAVTGIQRLGEDAVQVTYRTAQGATGSVTTRATSNGVQEESTLPPNVDSSAPRLAGAHS